jgi:uncharacterized tellurite resistance protein B-like protein
MELNLAEKLAVVKMIHTMVKADGVVHPKEIDTVKKLMIRIDFDNHQIALAKDIEQDQAIAILRKMTESKKEIVLEALKEIAQSDGFVHEKELELLGRVLYEMDN